MSQDFQLRRLKRKFVSVHTLEDTFGGDADSPQFLEDKKFFCFFLGRQLQKRGFIADLCFLLFQSNF